MPVRTGLFDTIQMCELNRVAVAFRWTRGCDDAQRHLPKQ